MAKQKFTVYVSASIRDWEFGRISVTDYNPEQYPDFKMALVSTHEIELEVPEFDIRDKAIVMLEQEIQKERADSQMRVNLLLERISKLQAIANEVAE